MTDVRYEIAKELTLKAIDKLDVRFGSDKPAIKRNELLAEEVGKLYKEIFKAVFDAEEILNK